MRSEESGLVCESGAPMAKAVGSMISKGFAVMEAPAMLRSEIWAKLDGIDSVPEQVKIDFSFAAATEGFLQQGGERAKYTENLDLCDRFCYWHRNRPLHEGKEFTKSELYKSIECCEELMYLLAQELISGIWQFFAGDDRICIRNNSYMQLCMYGNEHRAEDRNYLQDPHEDGHLITLIKPDREGLVIFPDGLSHLELPVQLRDNELIAISGSLLTALSDGRIPPMYHAVRNPQMRMKRKSVVYFAIPDLSATYTTLLAGKKINVAGMADESHQAFGNVSLI